MHVGIFRRIGLLDAVEHGLGLLRRRRVVEINQRLAIDLHGEDREILADAVDVIGAVAHRRMHRQLPRARSQATTCSISASRKPACSMPSIASPTKACTSSASASIFGNAARHQIELEVLVERARGGAVAALHVVGKNLELRLVVGLGLVGQQQRPRHHPGVGLLRMRPHHDLALEHAAALVVEHGREHLAALAAAGLVIDHQRGIDVLLALEQARAAKPACVPSPSKRTKVWLRTTPPPMLKAKSLKRAFAPIAAISDET